MTGLDQHVVLAAGDGSLGPLLRVADDRLAPGAGYGRHAHRAVDVVAVVLAGALRHDWTGGAALGEGDVAVLRAGAGLEHDERAGDGGARVLQCYLRGAAPTDPPSHAVQRSAAGWVDLDRPDARLFLARLDAGGSAVLPAGLVVLADSAGARAEVGSPSGRVVTAERPLTVLVWQLDTTRPAWATG
ncbi:pirin family protein [Geodermatophilus sp. YIM 151500]|uniref:pirin family protein n=1 Tax=Geodermatophilus sp. YIM 151500 TaxID=2984531 RepID=UPI0021E418F2|nr:pirin family protein [Geodermatophilus sp. YIM 151500]MCV2489946.1 pirin family protein [Geodermatophilus sp. YIM 151500]